MIGAVGFAGREPAASGSVPSQEGPWRSCPQRSLVIVQCSQVEPYTGKKRNAIRKNTVFIRRSPPPWNFFPLIRSRAFGLPEPLAAGKAVYLPGSNEPEHHAVAANPRQVVECSTFDLEQEKAAGRAKQRRE